MPCKRCGRQGHNTASCGSHPQGINTIPLEMTCPSCHGQAYVNSRDGFVACGTCGGRGVILRGLHY